MNLDQPRARLRLDAALDHLTVTFRGMTADPDESNCECHWGSAEDLAQLKIADKELDPDLLQRTWQATDWKNNASVLRRILPQFATSLVTGLVEPRFGMERVGFTFALGEWQEWPAEQAAAVEEFLHAWWAHTLTDPDPLVPAHDLLVLTAEASGTLRPWLDVWEALDDPVADAHLATAADHWDYDLLGDQLPWRAWENGEEMRTGLTAWLVGHASARLRAHGAPEDLLHRIRLLGVTGPDRWEDPHWPQYRY
ncbi:hypothetical protein ACFY8X_14280 [Streptomyces tanashiensis]|uniref:hypothetical protein n=1 Tax=Streptomyces tanashiensis TaxID=67367 RepID=UPI0034045578